MVQASSEADTPPHETDRQRARKSAGARGASSASPRSKPKRSAERVFQRELLDMVDALARTAGFLEGLHQASMVRGLSDVLADLDTRIASIQRSLERVVRAHGVRRAPPACKTARSLVQEASKARWDSDDGLEEGMGAITTLQKLLHCCIGSFSGLRAWSVLVHDGDAELLFSNVTEDLKAFDRDLSEVAARALSRDRAVPSLSNG